eukprot:gene23564-biopygen1275
MVGKYGAAGATEGKMSPLCGKIKANGGSRCPLVQRSTTYPPEYTAVLTTATACWAAQPHLAQQASTQCVIS